MGVVGLAVEDLEDAVVALLADPRPLVLAPRAGMGRAPLEGHA